MCGLAGQVCFGDDRTNPLVLRNMLLANEIRGRDATGAAYLHDGEILTLKKAVSPRTFADVEVTKKLWLDMANSPILLMHARHATQGAAKDNDNNHPVVACDWVVTHNGHVHNDYDLIAYYGMTEERPAEVDTVAINMALAQGETAEESLSHIALLGGTATFFAWNITRPDEIVLARVNGPALYLSLNREQRILYHSSDPDGLRYTQNRGVGVLPFVNVSLLPQNSAFVLNPFTGSIKQYDLYPASFHMPRIKKKEEAKEKTTTNSPLVTNFRPGDLTAIGGITHQPGPSSSDRSLVRMAEGVVSMVKRWFEKETGEGGEHLLILTKGMCVSVLGDYTKLSKPGPQFEAEMVGMAFTPLSSGEVKTPYGTWYLTPHHRWFRGAKRIKRHWDARVSPVLKRSIRLPAEPVLALALREKYQLETVRVYHKAEDPQAYVLGYMCPWCGIISLPRVWREWAYICAWCNVKSTPSGEGVSNAA